jgi:Ca2+-binding RTX toxin-like protein
MSRRTFVRLLCGGAGAVALLVLAAAQAAANTVPATYRADDTFAITANDLKPSECAALSLTGVVAPASGNNSQSLLILGTASGETINAASGSDCVVAGAGGDTVDGGSGTDVLLGGPGNDQLQGGTANDSLYGGPGADSLDGGNQTDYCDGGADADSGASCETSVSIP